MHVIVVGAGIVGLSSAYALTKRGVAVTLVERGGIPNPLAASADHHRLIRFAYGDADGYANRIREAFEAWRGMWRDLAEPAERYYAATGVLSTSQDAGDWTDRSRAVMDRLGIQYERIDGVAALAKRFPFLEAANVAYGVLSEGGALMANHILTDLAWWLRGEGAVVLEHAPVAAIEAEAGAVVLADGRRLEADCVVVAAGTETARLFPDDALPLTPHRTMVLYVEPPAHLRAAFDGAPCWTHLGGDAALWGMPPVGTLPAKLGASHLGRPDPEMGSRFMGQDEFELMRSQYRGRFRDADQFIVRWGQANYWTHAPKEKFLLKEVGRAFVVSADSGHGFKFGALTGQDVADAVTGASSVETVAARLAAEPAVA